MYRKSITGFFFLFAFFVIAISGYQCATNVSQDNSGAVPVNSEDRGQGVNPDNNRGDGYYYPDDYLRYDRDREDSRLPPEPEDNCPRSTYRQLADRFGELAVFRIDKGSLEEYRLGASLNFPLNCSRIFVDMSKASGSSVYKGTLTVAYDDGKSVKYQRYSSGHTADENRYNKWSGGSWRADEDGEVNRKFHAIYEDTDAAVIFKIDYIQERDIRDGEVELYAYGELYYKMFRYSKTAGQDDVCFTTGTYMRYFQGRAIPRRKKCWLLPTGPFSCRPNGVLEPRASFKNINITGDLPCYNRLGVFRNLHIKGAFNVNDIEDI